MSDPAPEAQPPQVYAQPWAIRLGFAVIVGFTLIVGVTFMELGKRKELETVSETTAVGDRALFTLPAPASTETPVATLNGRPLRLATGAKIDIRETHTQRVGQDAEKGLTIYELNERATAAEKALLTGGLRLLLKIGVNEFVVVRE